AERLQLALRGPRRPQRAGSTGKGDSQDVEHDRPRNAAIAKNGARGSLVEQMVSQGRVALLLRPQIAGSLSDVDLQTAQEALDNAMAMVPEGQVATRARCYESLDDEPAERVERLIP